MCVDLINLSFQMCFVVYPAICKVSSCRVCVCLQMYTYACIYIHIGYRPCPGEWERGMDNQLTVNWPCFSFLFALLFQDNKPSGLHPLHGPSLQAAGWFDVQPVLEHSAPSICCVLAACPYGAVSRGFCLPSARLALQLTTCRLQGF